MPLLLTTLDDYKTFADIADTSQDQQITDLITSCSARIEAYCRRDLDQKTYTDYLYGTGQEIMQVENYPVADGTVTVIIDAEIPVLDFRLKPETGELIRKNKWNRRYGYEVNYTAGFTTPPLDLQLACNLFISFMLQLNDHIGVSNESIGPLRNQYNAVGENLPEEVIPFVAPYRREPMV